MVGALDRKLLRNLRELRGQVITIALVVACGIAAYVTMQSAYASLHYSKTAYYEKYRFGDVFAHCKRAPETVRHELEALPGVARADTRIVETAMLPVEGLPEPASANLVSLPGDAMPELNALFLYDGRTVEPGHTDEVVVLRTFAQAHGLEPGDRLPAVINGKKRNLRIVGTAASPEYVMAIAPGDITPDPKRFAVLWMDRSVLAAAFEMQGAFNDVVLQVQPGATLDGVLGGVDRVLEPYGGFGAMPRKRQISNATLDGELLQLESMATVVPVIFLGVAAFLLNVVLSRLVFLQRSQIAALKALGYADRAIGVHFLKLVSVIVLFGAVLGVTLGAWLGHGMTEFYGDFFHFPVLEYRLEARVVLVSVVISLVAAVVGALATVQRIANLPPAEAMRPPPPASYKPTLVERLGLFSLLDPAERMIVREIQRRPLRLALSSLGIAMSVGIVVVGQFWGDAMDFLIDVQFERAMREDMNVTFAEPIEERALRDLAHVPGVLAVEGMREVPVRFRNGFRYRDSALIGYAEGNELRRVLDKMGNPVALPVEGVLLTNKLAEILDVEPGDSVEVELREGDRKTRTIPVAGLVDEAFGLQGHMNKAALHHVLREEALVTSAQLEVDSLRGDETRARLKEMPKVVSVTRVDNLRSRFSDQSQAMIMAFTIVLTLFAAAIAIGVVYNNARISLSMRSRDLASLRVLGFTRTEISAILLGELGIQILLAIPVGLVIGTYLATAMMQTVDPETYRFPVIISAKSYAFAALVALAAGLVSGLMVRRKLDKLDLIGVLKTRE